MKTKHSQETLLERFSELATRWTGGSLAFALAFLVVILWIATGPIFEYSDTWQLVINTGTTIVTFLMVFLIQRAQNKDSQAVHLKLNELVASTKGASNRLINFEELSEQEIRTLHAHYEKLVSLAKKDHKLTDSHSVEEAETRSKQKPARKPEAKRTRRKR